jgi:hypothetical protein
MVYRWWLNDGKMIIRKTSFFGHFSLNHFSFPRPIAASIILHIRSDRSHNWIGLAHEDLERRSGQESNIEKVKSGKWLIIYEKSNGRFIASIMKKIMTLYFDLWILIYIICC